MALMRKFRSLTTVHESVEGDFWQIVVEKVTVVKFGADNRGSYGIGLP